MRQLISELFAKGPLVGLPIVSLIIFALVYGLWVLRVVRRGAAAYDAEARLPLEDERE
jgi:cbb3-type cytochrome oxidase subunit 3